MNESMNDACDPLASRTCKPCHGDTPALTDAECSQYMQELQGWELSAQGHLQRTVKLKNFAQALQLANRIGALAEEQGHHPDLLVRWGELKIELWTHAINGLSEADFVLAAKIDQLMN